MTNSDTYIKHQKACIKTLIRSKQFQFTKKFNSAVQKETYHDKSL